jgi:hypothetical protein
MPPADGISAHRSPIRAARECRFRRFWGGFWPFSSRFSMENRVFHAETVEKWPKSDVFDAVFVVKKREKKDDDDDRKNALLKKNTHKKTEKPYKNQTKIYKNNQNPIQCNKNPKIIPKTTLFYNKIPIKSI